MRLCAAAGALLAAAGVALLAYAAHAAAADPQAHARLFNAGVIALIHGGVLAVGARRAHGIGRLAMTLLLFGTVLFAGSLGVAHASGGGAPLAPIGGGCSILAWVLYAFARLRP